jgi:hypothetical protein
MSPSSASPRMTTAPTTAPTAFRGSMDALALVLARLLPDALRGGPVDAERAARLRGDIAALQQVSHALVTLPGAVLPDADPTVGIVMGELARAVDDVALSHADRLPQTALSLASTCIACHTRSKAPSLAGSVVPLDAAIPEDVRADIAAATRRFDDARAIYREVVFDEAFAAREPWRWERAVRRALALEVRVYGDPASSSSLAAQVLATPSAEALWPAADAWQRDLLAWRRERAAGGDHTGDRTDGDDFDRAARLMNQALQEQRRLGDASAEVLLLRASAALHRVLSSSAARPPAQRAQALAWLGVAYEQLTELDVWGLFLSFDAACVETLPQTPLSRSCFARYERATLELFSGTGGTSLPPATKTRLEALRRKAR